jgi:hypothetical protein
MISTTMDEISIGMTELAELAMPSLRNMTIEDINVGETELERLGFTADKVVNSMPGSCRSVPPTHTQNENKRLPGAGTPGIRKQINATLSSRQLMRQMSGLGMEDPIFKTTEAELTPAHPSNIFDDMSLGDIAEDMRDMISIASDPTAAGGDGLDVDMFQASLGCLNASISDFSSFKLSLHSKDTTKSDLRVLSSPFKPVLTSESALLLHLTDSLRKLPMETSLAKPKVSPGEECGKTSRGKPSAQRLRPPMEDIVEENVASLGVESVVDLALLEKDQQLKAEEQKRLERQERLEKKERLKKQQRLDTLEKLETMSKAKMPSHHKARSSRTPSSSSKSSLPEPPSPRISNTDKLLLESPKATEREDNATALIQSPTSLKQQEHEQSKPKISSHHRSRPSRTPSSSSKSSRLPEPQSPRTSNTDNLLLGAPTTTEEQGDPASCTDNLIAVALIQSSTSPTQQEHDQSKPKISSHRKSRSSKSSRLNESQSSRRSSTSSTLVGAQSNEMSSSKDLFVTALSKSPTSAIQQEHEQHLTLPPVTNLHTVQNDESSNSNSSKNKISRSNSNRRSTSRTPSNRRSTSMTPGDRRSTSRTPSTRRSASRTPSSSSRRVEGSAGREALSPRARNTNNNLVGAVKATETQGNAISCNKDSIATALCKSPNKSTQEEHEQHLTLPPVTNLHTVQNDESSNSKTSKTSRSNSNRRSTSRTPSNRRSTSRTPSNRRSTSMTPGDRRSTSRTPSSSSRRAEGPAGRSRCSEKDAHATYE